MKKYILVFLLVVLPVYLIITISFLNKESFVCPITYERDYAVRCDSWGDGFFAASRSNGSRLHLGIDLMANIGTPVLACRSGKVLSAFQNKGMGNYVIIKHGDGLVTLYGHLSEIFVQNNQWVRQGQVIGSVGKTGNANRPHMLPHLHFEVRKEGLHLDPAQYLP